MYLPSLNCLALLIQVMYLISEVIELWDNELPPKCSFHKGHVWSDSSAQ